jgi:mono/diheme cytochrome c family protein
MHAMERHRYWSLALGLIIWGVVLWLHRSPAANLPAELRAAPPARTSMAATIRSPARSYETACASCHQAGGEGRFPVFPPLAGSPWVSGDPDRLVALTLHGLSGPVDVNGVNYSGLMPGFANMSDHEIAEVLSRVRTSWGNDAPPISEAEVAAGRMRMAYRRIPWTATELRAVSGSSR